MSIDKINARLKAAKLGVSVHQRGDRLALRATLPPKTHKGETEPKQRVISLGIYANPKGLKQAEAEAKKLGGQLACKDFSWADWEEQIEGDAGTVASWVQRFEDDYFTRRSRNPKSETTWRSDYHQVFKWLEPEATLSADLMRQAIIATEPDTRTRQRRCMVLGALAKFAGIELDAKSYRGDYSPKRLNPRELPTDAEISQWRDRIENSQWQYAFGLMACYGLRNHELWHIDLERLRRNPVLSLLEDDNGGGKTGARRVWACYPEWWDAWHLWDISLLPKVTGKDNSDLGNRVTVAFNRFGFKKPYNLRHAWAIRTIEFDIPVELAAQQMGHSLKVHSEIYHYWISDDVHQRAFDRAMQKSDRPMPP